MNLRQATTRSVRAASSTARLDATSGLTNVRTRIVGDRTGFFADLVVTVVRVWRNFSAGFVAVARRAMAVVTPLGWWMLLLVPLAFVFGYRLGWVELVAIAYAGAVILLIAAISLFGHSAVAIELRLANPRVVVGQESVGTLRVANPTGHRRSGVVVEIPLGTGLVELSTPGLSAGAVVEKEFIIPTVRRGVLRVGPARTVRADPIGLVRRELIWSGAGELFIHPRTIGIPSTSTGLIRDLEGNPTRDLSNSDVSFHALREYIAGDERRYIHWKSTAKTGVHMVRQFEETRRSHLLIAVSLASSDYATDDEFELAVSVAGSLGIRAIRDARTVSVVAGERTPDFAKRKVLAVRQFSTITRNRLLDDLAGVEHAESALAIRDIAMVISEKVVGISVAFLVCGSKATPAELRAASAKFPLGVDVVIVVCDPETVPGFRQIAGFSVLTVGYLEDLQKSLSRAAAA